MDKQEITKTGGSIAKEERNGARWRHSKLLKVRVTNDALSGKAE